MRSFGLTKNASDKSSARPMDNVPVDKDFKGSFITPLKSCTSGARSKSFLSSKNTRSKSPKGSKNTRSKGLYGSKNTPPPTPYILNKKSNDVTSGKTSSDGWTEVKSRSKSSKGSKNSSKGRYGSKNTSSKGRYGSKNTRSKNSKGSENTRSKGLNDSKSTRSKGRYGSKNSSKGHYGSKNSSKGRYGSKNSSKGLNDSKNTPKRDAKSLESVVKKLSKELKNHTKRSENGDEEEALRTLLYLRKASVGFPGPKTFYVGEEKMKVDMGTMGDLVEAIFSYTHVNLKRKIQAKMHFWLKEAIHMLLHYKGIKRWSPHSLKRGKGLWSAEIVGNELKLEVTPENIEFILNFLTEEDNMRRLMKECPEMWNTLSPISLDTSNLAGSFDAFCLKLFSQCLNVCANRTRSGVVFRAVAPNSQIVDIFYDDYVHPPLEPVVEVVDDVPYEISVPELVIPNIMTYPIHPPREVVEVAKVEENVDFSSDKAFPPLGGKVETVDTKVMATSSAWSKPLPKLTADAFSEYNRQAEIESLNKKKKQEAQRRLEKKARMDAIEDNELFELAKEKALDLNDFSHGQVLDPTVILKQAQSIYDELKEKEKDEEYRRMVQLEMSKLDSWEDYSDYSD